MTRLELLAAPRTRQVIGVVTFTVLTALAAKLSLPIPGTQVPFTFGPLVVLLAGALLGARMGAASQVLYLLAGIAGLPVFALLGAGLPYLLGPTGGYLLAYPVAAYVAGSMSGPGVARKAVAFLAALGTIYVGGVAWLTILSGWSVAIVVGVLPFLVADLVKVVLAVLVAHQLQDRARRLFNAVE